MAAAVALVRRLGLPITDLTLIEQALVHGSLPNEQPDTGIVSNERLEFLGDTVLNLLVSESLFQRFPDADEGELTARRAVIVSTTGLARVARRISVGDVLQVGQGAERTGTRRRPSVLAAALEAVVGAVYLSLGIEEVRRWLARLLASELESSIPVHALKSPKNRLQEFIHSHALHQPTYRLLSVEGPEHRRHFVVEVVLGERGAWRGEGESRRVAETVAAESALRELLEAKAGHGSRA